MASNVSLMYSISGRSQWLGAGGCHQDMFMFCAEDDRGTFTVLSVLLFIKRERLRNNFARATSLFGGPLVGPFSGCCQVGYYFLVSTQLATLGVAKPPVTHAWAVANPNNIKTLAKAMI